MIEEKRGVLRVPDRRRLPPRRRLGRLAVRDGRAKLIPVTLGAKSDVDVEVAQGVAERDVVVVHPGEKVSEGVLLTGR